MSSTIGRIAAALVLIAVAGVANGDTWLRFDDSGALAPSAGVTPNAPTLSVVSSNLAGLSLTVETEGVLLRESVNATGEYVEVNWPGASIAGEIGTPALPVVRRLFVLPGGASMSWDYASVPARSVILADCGMPTWVLPAQPPIEKVPGARENAEFVLDATTYATNADLPAERVSVLELGTYRGQRLCMLEVYPIAHNPAAGTLAVWPRIAVDIKFAGGSVGADAFAPAPWLAGRILNPDVLPDGPGRDAKDYLIVVAPAYEATIAPFAAAKQAQGFVVSTWVPPSANAAVIKDHIQGLWGGASQPEYVLLVGDTDTIPKWTGGGAGSPDTDLPYVCMDGPSDWYPDIAIGRFPARSTGTLEDIVAKTLYYESGALSDPGYLKRAVFMASEDNYTVSEGTHNWCIDNYMIPNDIAFDKLYCHTYNATTQQVRDAFNDGRFFGIYSGHGGETSWADGPPFSQGDVRNLVNGEMYAFVTSFACVTGSYALDECFTETWIRVANKGAISIYGSSVNSYWTEDDVLQKRLFDSMYDLDDDVPSEVSPVWQDAFVRYLAEMGAGSTTRRYFEMYNLMGDPSLRFPGACSDAGELTLDRGTYGCEDTVAIMVVDCGLNTNGNLIEQVTVDIASDSEPGGEPVVLTETGPGTAEFTGAIDTSATNSAGVLLVADGDQITVTYIDADNGQGGYNVEITAEADVDCVAPSINDVVAFDIGSDHATITFDSNEPVKATVYYGLECGALTEQVSSATYELSPVVEVTGLTQNTKYYFAVEAEDLVSNATYDDNGGNCHDFETERGPEAAFAFDMDSDPGWTTEAAWAWGQPTGQGGAYGGPDPSAGHTGSNVYGYNLSGDYTNNMPERHLTTTALDCTGLIEVKLRFWRWLGVERSQYDHAYVRISNDGANWTTLWQNPDSETADNSWVYQEYDIDAQARNQPTVYLRWTMGTTDGGWAYCGWNVDDVEVWAIVPVQVLVGDLNCDGEVDFGDINPFVLALTDPAGYEAQFPDCPFENRDINSDGKCDFGDINPFVRLLTQ